MDIGTATLGILTGGQMTGLVALMVANLLLSIAAATKNKVFSLGHLGDFVPNRIWPLIAWIVVAILAATSGEWGAMAGLVYAGVVAIYTRGILAAIKSLTGLPIPDFISEKK